MPDQPRPSMPCERCLYSAEPGWLCEDHAGKPWGHDGCQGAGARCVCNPTGLVNWRHIHARVGGIPPLLS
jgi:hypothetical protein